MAKKKPQKNQRWHLILKPSWLENKWCYVTGKGFLTVSKNNAERGIFVVYRCLSTSSQLQLGKPSLRLSGWPVVRQRVMVLAIEIHADRHTGGVSLSLWGESDWLTKYDWAPCVLAHLELTEWREGKADLWGVAKGKNAKTQCACLCVMICALWLWSFRVCGCEGNCEGGRQRGFCRPFIHSSFLL